MINKINNVSFKKNQSFKGNNEKINANWVLSKENFKNSDKISLAATSIGLLSAASIALLSRKYEKFDNNYFKAFYGVSAALVAAGGYINLKSAAKFSKKYAPKEEQVEFEKMNGFQKFVKTLSMPQPFDFGNEEANKEYYELKTKENKIQNRTTIPSVLVGVLAGVATKMATVNKDIYDKKGLAILAGVASMAITTIVGSIINMPKVKELYENSKHFKLGENGK